VSTVTGQGSGHAAALALGGGRQGGRAGRRRHGHEDGDRGQLPVLGFGQKRIAGFSNGHLIHYYDDGPVKVKARE
jgi:hypothetical protein